MTAFGTQFMPKMIQTTFDGANWSDSEVVSGDTLSMHPGAHVLHYASSCFEGLKAFKHEEGSVNIFRPDANIKRMAQSSNLLSLPEIDQAQVMQMLLDILGLYKDEVPMPPNSMYIRPTHFGTEAAIGKAAHPSATSLFYILLSPVGAYFAGGSQSLLLEENNMRCAPHMGMIKSGGNYASALKLITDAKAEYGVDQVLFCPDGYIQETGAANFILIDGDTLITKALDPSFLHGITRDSILTLAKDKGLKVEEREISIEELIERSQKPNTEAALSGTAAVLTPVGKLVHNGKSHQVGTGEEGPTTLMLKNALNDIQWGKAEDKFNWLVKVD